MGKIPLLGLKYRSYNVKTTNRQCIRNEYAVLDIFCKISFSQHLPLTDYYCKICLPRLKLEIEFQLEIKSNIQSIRIISATKQTKKTSGMISK